MTTQPTIKPRLGQLRAGNVLSRLAGPTATDGDTIMLGVNAEATPPLALSPANPASLVVNIGAITVTNPNTGMVQSPSPIGGSLATFTGGTVTFPSTSGGNAVPSAGSSVVITIPSGDYLRVILAVDGNGNIVVIPGTPSSTIFLTPFPTITRTDIYQAGWVLLQNVAGTIQNISTVYQFKSSGGSGGAGGLVPAYESTSFTAATGSNYLTNTSTAPVIATLPTGATASSIRFTDDAATWGTNNLTITPASGEQIQGCATNESLVCDLSGAWVELDWDPTNSWWVVSSNGFAASVSTGSGGSGEKTYIPAASQSTSTGWASVAGTGGVTNATVTISTDVSPADLPRAQTTKTGIKFVASAASGGTPVAAFGFLTWQLDPADYNKKLKVQFDMNALAGYTSGDYSIEVHSGTTAFNATTGVTAGTDAKLPLSTDSSGATTLPALEGTFRTTFDAPGSAAPYILLKVIPKTTAASSLVLSDLIVGPGVVVQGAAMGPSGTAFTPTLGNIGTATFTTSTWYYKQVGDTYEITGYLSVNAAGSGASAVTFTLPNGYSVNTAAIAQGAGTDRGSLGYGQYKVNGTGNYDAYPVYDSTTTLALVVHNATAGKTWTGADLKAGDELWVTARVPVSQLAGSGTVNVAQNDVAYYYGTGGTWGTSSTITTAQGPSGVLGGTTTPSGTGFSYTFTPTAPVPIGAVPILEVSQDGIHFSPTGAVAGGNIIENLRSDGTNYIGAAAYLNTSGQIAVLFGKYSWGSTGAWTGTWYWRVVVGLPGQAVGFGIVQPGIASGLVSASGVPGNTTGNAIASGYVGQTITQTAGGTAISSSGAATNIIGPYTVPAGVWIVTGNVYASVSAVGTLTGFACGLSTTSSGFDNTAYATLLSSGFATTAADFDVGTPPRVIVSSGATNLYLVGRLTYTGTYTGNWTSTSSFTLTRIA